MIDTREIDIMADSEVPHFEVSPKLILMQGLPRSGKSTWARAQGYPIVDPDAIRLVKTGRRWWGPIEHEVWATARTMIRALFVAGHEIVILDSTAYTRWQRDQFKPSLDIPWIRYIKHIDTPANVCCERAQMTYPDLISVIKYMETKWEPVDFDVEGIQLCTALA